MLPVSKSGMAAVVLHRRGGELEVVDEWQVYRHRGVLCSPAAYDAKPTDREFRFARLTLRRHGAAVLAGRVRRG